VRAANIYLSLEETQIHFGDQVWEGKKSDGANYRLIFERAQTELRTGGWLKIAQVKQEGPNIIANAEENPDCQTIVEEDWKDMLSWPALGTVGEALRRAIRKPPGANGSHSPPTADPLVKPPQAPAPPALRPTVHPDWALFKLKPADGPMDVQTPHGGLEVYAFDWMEEIQYWWTYEYDAFADQHGQDGKKIVIIDEKWN
jgi:hypothetical protein